MWDKFRLFRAASHRDAVTWVDVSCRRPRCLRHCRSFSLMFPGFVTVGRLFVACKTAGRPLAHPPLIVTQKKCVGVRVFPVPCRAFEMRVLLLFAAQGEGSTATPVAPPEYAHAIQSYHSCCGAARVAMPAPSVLLWFSLCCPVQPSV